MGQVGGRDHRWKEKNDRAGERADCPGQREESGLSADQEQCRARCWDVVLPSHTLTLTGETRAGGACGCTEGNGTNTPIPVTHGGPSALTAKGIQLVLFMHNC